MLEDRPQHVRKRIALLVAGGVGIVLVAILVAMYTTKQGEHTDSGAKLKDFYTTLRATGQSFFEGK